MKLSAILTSLAIGSRALQQSLPFCFNVGYDDLRGGTNGLNADRVGTYYGLTYESFVVAASNAAGSSAGVIPSSPRNAILSALVGNLLNLQSPIFPFGTLSASPGVQHFSMHSFSFGCGLNTVDGGLINAGQGCTITVCGVTTTGQTLPCQEFSHDAPIIALTPQPMTFASLKPALTGLRSVTFGLTQTNLGPAGTIAGVLQLDNVTHCNTYGTSADTGSSFIGNTPPS